jgi:hypothetical protein
MARRGEDARKVRMSIPTHAECAGDEEFFGPPGPFAGE